MKNKMFSTIKNTSNMERKVFSNMKKKVFILHSVWQECNVSGNKIIGVYSSQNLAEKMLKSFVINELLPSLTEFFEVTDGELVLTHQDKVEDYILKDDYFLFKDQNGEYVVEVSIEVFEIDK
jgi:hypothetical protein